MANETQGKPTERKTIVVVDDERDITDLYKALLEDDYNVLEFNRPEDFLKYLQFHTPGKVPFQALITDFKMPKMNGMDMVAAAHSLGYKFPFIILSGHLDKDTVIRAVDFGVFRLLEKPAPPKVLFDTISQIIVEQDIHATRDEVRQIIAKMHENYSFLRLALLNYIPEEALDQMILQTNPSGKVIKTEGFEDLMQDLESRLDQLLKTEKSLEASQKSDKVKTAS
jgi:two-component system response regulator ArlR